jgi:hypothetical protein
MKKYLLTILVLFFGANLFAQTDNSDVFSKMRTSTSGNSVYYYDKSSPNTTYIKAFYIYVIKPTNAKPYLMVRLQYSGSSAIDVYAYNVMTDKHSSYNITPPTEVITKLSDNNYNDFRSYCDLQVGDKFLNVLRRILSAENPKLEYLGTIDNLTVKISKNEVNAISNVLDVYDALNK